MSLIYIIWNSKEHFCWIENKKIRWENRLINDTGNDALVTVDGTDFRIREPIPFNRKWYSNKFNGPALRYEVGVSINTGYIVWFNGPFPAGMMPDIKIFESNLKWKLNSGERVVADKGYTGYLKYFVPSQQKMINTEKKCRKQEQGTKQSTGDSKSGNAYNNVGVTIGKSII